MYYRIVLSVLAIVVFASACASSGQQRTRRDRERISRQEIQEEGPFNNAYQIVQRLRPLWLRKRGNSSIDPQREGEILVYLDDQRYGGPESLRTITAENVGSIRFLDPGKATMRYGSGHVHGVIRVAVRSQ